jgi:selenide,water dikinase
MAVTGIIDPQKVKIKGGARRGDILLLTKPLGVGVITTALKQQIAAEEHVAVAVESMKALNKEAAIAAHSAAANAVTDITGFGLLGHAHEMAAQGNVDFRFYLDQLPWLPGAISYGKERAFPGGMGNNMRFFSKHIVFEDGISVLMQDMLFTPETSGGLLVAVTPEMVQRFQVQFGPAVAIGEVFEGSGQIHVLTTNAS